ncbi:Hypothetical predicted protein [Mytilus galloprovincialis]|nr:Hypothetical predicted protein [Mytilus galloprovincialis]
MFDHMIQSNDSLKKEFDKIFKVKDLKFIKDLINGEVTEDVPQQKGSEVVEDDSQQYKKYMFEIVANKQNSIDVDKMDYFARDCHGLGISSNFNHLRFISQCRIMFPFKDSNQTTIAVRDKELTEKKLKKYEEDLLKNDKQFGKDDFNLQTLMFSYGKDSRNPIKFVYFYKKDSDECLEGKDPDKVTIVYDCRYYAETETGSSSRPAVVASPGPKTNVARIIKDLKLTLNGKK